MHSAINIFLRVAALINIVAAVILVYANEPLWAALEFIIGVIIFGSTMFRVKEDPEEVRSSSE